MGRPLQDPGTGDLPLAAGVEVEGSERPLGLFILSALS